MPSKPPCATQVALYEERTLGRSSVPALRDGPDSKAFCDLYYGLKNDHSGAPGADSAAAVGRRRG